MPTDYVSADKGYNSEIFRENIINQGAKVITPKKINTLTNNDHMDGYMYKTRHLVKNAFARLKHLRDIATVILPFLTPFKSRRFFMVY